MHLPQRKSPRASWHDYTSPGGYFVTICTKNREHYFGRIIDSQMILHELGKYTTEHRGQISDHYPFVVCDEFVCMPNHIHGILIIKNRVYQNPIGTQFPVGTQFLASRDKTASRDKKPKNGIYENRMYKNTSLQVTSGSLGAIVRGFKIGITKYAKQNNYAFKRQSRYHDSIIRNEESYNNIKQYIQNNPKNRKEDRFH